MITVVGMGRKSGDLTADGYQAIKNADVVVVKSQQTHCAQTVASIRSDAIFCDDLYANAEDFDQLNNQIISKLQSFGNKKVVFCVVGEGADDSTAQLLDGVNVIYGVGLQGNVVGNDLPSNTALFTAQDVVASKRILPQPTVVKYVDDKYIASEVQLKLLQVFDDDTPVVFCNRAGNAKQIQLCDLCKQRYDYQTTIFIKPKSLAERQAFDYYDCADILSILRGENGCPWDREQTHKSISKNVIEEAYELATALENEDVSNVVEELGDLLMQVLFHIDIGVQEGEYDATAVYTALCRKLIDRHPHVFGDVTAQTPEQSLDVWNKQKQKEHKIKGTAQNLADVPVGMSMLMRCQKIQSRASKGGYQLDTTEQTLAKVEQALNQLVTADDESKQRLGGKLLFYVAQLLRQKEVDGETALLDATQKFVEVVTYCEQLLQQKGLRAQSLTQEQLKSLWSEAKNHDR